jgi:hypothetical protein
LNERQKRIRRQKAKKMAGEAIVRGTRAMLELVGAGIVVAIVWIFLILLFSL